MSKAFTKEEEGAGFTHESARRLVPDRVTALGARLASGRRDEAVTRLERATRLDERVLLEVERDRMAAIANARVAPLPSDTTTVAFGARVRLRDPEGKARTVFVASSHEIGLVPNAASVTSPLATSLMGARAGETVEVHGPRGGELTIVEVEFPR